MPDLYQQLISKVYQAKLSNLISELLEEYVIVSMDSSKLGALYDSSTAYLPDPFFSCETEKWMISCGAY